MYNFENINWEEPHRAINQKGYTILKSQLDQLECKKLIDIYDQNERFRKTINMARYRFGSGEYRYFSYPLPTVIQELRRQLYSKLVPIANHWMSVLNTGIHFPKNHDKFIEECHQKTQVRPTPLILKYQPGDFNTLHQDLYGEIFFPFQAILFLSQPGDDYEGGELVLTEQVPRAQSKARVIKPDQGDIIIITTQFRPEKGKRGYYRTNMRHGVSEVLEGTRHTVGIIFHDAL